MARNVHWLAQHRWTKLVREAEREQRAAQAVIYNALEREHYRRNPKASYDDDLIFDTTDGSVVVRGDGDVGPSARNKALGAWHAACANDRVCDIPALGGRLRLPAHLALVGPEAESGRALLDHEGRDALGARLAGAGHDDIDVRHPAAANEGLGPVTGQDDKAIVNEVERGEDHIKAKFESALKDNDLSGTTRAAIETAYGSVRAGHDEMRDLKHTLEATGSPRRQTLRQSLIEPPTLPGLCAGPGENGDMTLSDLNTPTGRRALLAYLAAWGLATAYLALRGADWVFPLISLGIFGIALSAVAFALTRRIAVPALVIARPRREALAMIGYVALYATVFVGWGLGAVKAALPAGPAHELVVLGYKLLIHVVLPAALIVALGGLVRPLLRGVVGGAAAGSSGAAPEARQVARDLHRLV
eukprot:gene31547-42060_t